MCGDCRCALTTPTQRGCPPVSLYLPSATATQQEVMAATQMPPVLQAANRACAVVPHHLAAGSLSLVGLEERLSPVGPGWYNGSGDERLHSGMTAPYYLHLPLLTRPGCLVPGMSQASVRGKVTAPTPSCSAILLKCCNLFPGEPLPCCPT